MRAAFVHALTTELSRHRLDTMSQDSGKHCTCGSDNRFDTRLGEKWENIDQHRAQITEKMIDAEIAEARRQGAILAFRWASVNVRDYDMFEDDYAVTTEGFSSFMADCAKLPEWCVWENGDATPWLSL